MALGHFNARNKLWFDQDNTSYEGSILKDLMAQYGLTQTFMNQHIYSNLQFLVLI